MAAPSTSKTSASVQALQRQRLLLQMEYYAEKEAYRKQAEQIGVARKVRQGDAWYPLRIGRSYYNSLNQLSLEVFRTADGESDHNFEYGRQLTFFRCRERSDGDRRMVVHDFPFSAVVSFVDGDRMVVTVPDNAPVAELQHGSDAIGCRLSFDETSYRAMFDALDRAIKAKDNRLAALRDWIHAPSPSRSSLRTDTSASQKTPIRLPWLNPAQERAVNEVIWAKDVAVVHGPPGTGKTTTLVEAINETLMREPQVLVCAQSNMAVDWISEKLVDRGIRVLRLGNPTRVNDKMLSFTYERRFEAHPDYTTLWSIRKAIRELRQHRRHADGYHQKIDRLKSRAAEIELRINAELFSQANVIASTLVGADSHLLHGMKFHTLFIDEAAQALEAACWIPMRRAHRVILAGDHCQLPPTVKSMAALKAGLGVTLMERIVERHPEVVTLLRIQYRMNEQIMRFPNEWFYGGNVACAPQVKHRGILDWDYAIEWREPAHIHEQSDDSIPQFLLRQANKLERGDRFADWGNGDSSSYGETTTASLSLVNKAEADFTLTTLEEYLAKIGKQRVLEEQIDIGIISPYRAQVQYLRQLIKKRVVFKPYRHLLSVNTVDGFQGQERDVIIISMVRSNADGQIGFLRDLRRMNVAITRARMKLIIIGDASTLTRHPFYRRLYDYVSELHEKGDSTL